MKEAEVIKYLKKKLKFDDVSIKKLYTFTNLLLNANKKYNLIGKSTENFIWTRHILDSAQLINYLDDNTKKIADFGTGAGFPGIILSIFNTKNKFHVKLYEKSPIKRSFLKDVKRQINIKCEIRENVYDKYIDADVIVARAFKKLSEIINISREITNKKHKILILKGKNAQKEINKVSLHKNYSYKLYNSITDVDSKIILLEKKNEK